MPETSRRNGWNEGMIETASSINLTVPRVSDYLHITLLVIGFGGRFLTAIPKCASGDKGLTSSERLYPNSEN